MNTSFHSQVKAAFDEIVERTPDIGGTPSRDLVTLTSGPGRSPRRHLMLAAAATIAVVGVAGMIALQSSRSAPSDAAPAAQPPATDSTGAPPTSPPPTSPTPTTMVLDVAPLIEPGSVVCVSAGASPRAIGLCVDELGGEVREATIASEDSFVMPLNPDDPAHLNAARNVADLLGLPVRELDPQLVPIAETLNEAVTSYLVIGTSDAPYSLPQNPGEGTPTTLSGTNSVSSVEQIYTVVPGDTVERIAGRYGYPPAQIDVLVEHNGWPSADVILFPGDIVRIPPGAIIPTNE